MKGEHFNSPLSLWVCERTNKKTGTSEWLQFLKVSNKVSVGVKAGYSLKMIHSHLTKVGELTCHYDTFLRYQRKYLSQQSSKK